MKTLRILVTAFLATGLATGCSADEKSAETPVKVGPVATPTAATTTKMPLAAYLPTEDELNTLARAQTSLLRDCMAEYGFADSELEAPSEWLLFKDISEGTGLPVTLEQAQRYGYHPAGTDTGGDSDDQEAGSDSPSGLPALATGDKQTELLVANGPAAVAGASPAASGQRVNGKEVPEGGCAGRAQQTIAKNTPALKKFGSDNADPLNAILEIRAESHSSAMQTTLFENMEKSWSACMKKSGFSYGSLKSAAEDGEWSNNQVASEREISVATADVRCRMSANYLGVTEAVFLAYEKQAVEDNAELLQAVRDYYDAMLRNAAKVV
ncbi:hypothetical protein [Streptomyces geranii]|uniref:hypothetical protein n=1 Tax=Streptomyces geranii TaxID=2058923 RepID=UPI001300608B|nr:hypothetical protein [Streptomyces geranii]